MKKVFAAFLCLFSSLLWSQTISVRLSEKPVTGGFADMGKLSYGKKKVVEISDAKYPDPVEKRKAFTKAIGGSGALTVVLSGDVDLSDGLISDDDHSYFDKFDSGAHRRVHEDITFPISSGKTILGKDNARIKFGGLRIDDSKNIIIRNVEFWDAHGSTEYWTETSPESKASADALVIWDRKGPLPSDIWIDHCTFSDGKCVDMKRNFNHDGLIDILGGKNITISYCEFKNHDKVMLVGSGEKFTNPKERQVTLHHNYFHGTTQRHPRSRGTQMHIYNNVLEDIGVPGNGGYMFGPGTGSQYIVEGNYIGSHMEYIVSYFDKSRLEEHTFSNFFQKGNSVEITEKDVKWDGPEKSRSFITHFVNSIEKMPWRIPYRYDLETFEQAFNNVKLNAGAGKNLEIRK